MSGFDRFRTRPSRATNVAPGVGPSVSIDYSLAICGTRLMEVKYIMFKYSFVISMVAAGVILSGCSQQSVQSTSNDISNGLQTANTEAKKVGQDVAPSLKKLDLGTRVTTALRANANLPDTIRVDASTTGVRLKGTVKTAEQKTLAGKVAKSTLPSGKSVDNELTVKSG